MKIALFTDTFYQINGVSMVYQRFARWCAGRNLELEIFTPGTHPDYRLENVSVRSIDTITPVPYYHNLYFDALPLRPKLEKHFLKETYDLVHIATQGHMAIIGLRAAGVAGLRKISCYHTKLPEYAASRFLRFFGDNFLGRPAARLAESLSWWYQRQLYQSSQLILVPTESARGIIEKKVNIPTAVFSRGVDTRAYNPDHRIRDDDSEPKTLFVGRLSVEKNLDLLARLITEEGKGLVIVGDGPYREKLNRKLPNACFPGFLTGWRLQRQYASADVFAFPSKTETFGNAVLEAMASGLPVLVTDEGGPKDFVVDGQTGFIARSDDEFIERHRQLISDAELRRRIGSRAREYAKTQSWDYVFEEQLLGNYRRVIDGRV